MPVVITDSIPFTEEGLYACRFITDDEMLDLVNEVYEGKFTPLVRSDDVAKALMEHYSISVAAAADADHEVSKENVYLLYMADRPGFRQVSFIPSS